VARQAGATGARLTASHWQGTRGRIGCAAAERGSAASGRNRAINAPALRWRPWDIILATPSATGSPICYRFRARSGWRAGDSRLYRGPERFTLPAGRLPPSAVRCGYVRQGLSIGSRMRKPERARGLCGDFLSDATCSQLEAATRDGAECRVPPLSLWTREKMAHVKGSDPCRFTVESDRARTCGGYLMRLALSRLLHPGQSACRWWR